MAIIFLLPSFRTRSKDATSAFRQLHSFRDQVDRDVWAVLHPPPVLMNSALVSLLTINMKRAGGGVADAPGPAMKQLQFEYGAALVKGAKRQVLFNTVHGAVSTALQPRGTGTSRRLQPPPGVSSPHEVDWTPRWEAQVHGPPPKTLLPPSIAFIFG